MKPIHLLAGLLAALAILLDLAVLTGFESGYDAPLMLFTGLAFGQFALLTFWCVLGRGLLPVRLLVTLAAAVCMSRPLSAVTIGSWPQWFTLFCWFASCAAGTLLLARAFGIRPLIVNASASAATSISKKKRRTQFSLGTLLSVMTLIGIALGVSRHLAFPEEHLLAVAGYGLWLALISLTALWALVSRGALVLRLIGLTAMCLVAGWFMARTDYRQGVWFFSNVALVESISICAGIAVLQMGSGRVPNVATETAV